MARANIIGKSNGVGLTRHIKILADALRAEGYDVQVTPTGSRHSRQRKSVLARWVRAIRPRLRAKRQPHFEINVMLEHVWAQFAGQASYNVVVPSPEFFDQHDVNTLPLVDKIWATTREAERIFSQLGCSVSFIGFDSEDRRDQPDRPHEPREREKIFFHLAGSSPLKGTTRLLEIWSRHPQWPLLNVVGRVAAPRVPAPNVRIYAGYMENTELQALQNRSAIHICTSETEAWGHYLVEGLGVGALVVTLDAPPMNELVAHERGLLLSCHAGRRQKLAQCYRFDEVALVDAVQQILEMPEHELAAIGERARAWFLNNKNGFNARVHAALGELRA